MQFPKGSGLDALNRIVHRSLDYYAGAFKTIKPGQSLFHSLKKIPPITFPSLADLRKPMESLLKNISNTVAQLQHATKPVEINYNAVVNSFLPPGAKLIRPAYPNSNEIQFSDIDGDSRNELIVSYKTNEGIRTMVLKKDEVQWCKIAEIENVNFNGIHYRACADIAGDGKKYLLLGLASKGKKRTLFAYSLTDGSAKRIFSRDYDKLELQKTRSASGVVKDAVALWNEDLPGIYNIELVHWNGIDLEKLDQSRYFAGKVIPYYLRKVRQNPNNSAHWYNLANTLAMAGDKASAARAVRIGLENNPDALLREKFNALQSRL